MNGQTPKLSLIAMFYLVVFASAFTVAGVLHSQRDRFPDVAEKAKTLVFSSPADSIPATTVSAEAGKEAVQVSEGETKSGETSFLRSFHFAAVIQWLLRLPARWG